METWSVILFLSIHAKQICVLSSAMKLGPGCQPSCSTPIQINVTKKRLGGQIGLESVFIVKGTLLFISNVANNTRAAPCCCFSGCLDDAAGLFGKHCSASRCWSLRGKEGTRLVITQNKY